MREEADKFLELSLVYPIYLTDRQITSTLQIHSWRVYSKCIYDTMMKNLENNLIIEKRRKFQM